MRNIVRTIYGSALQTARLSGSQHTIPANSTLNEAILNADIIPHMTSPVNRGMEVLPNYNPVADSDDLNLKILCIGNGGHRNAVGADGVPFTDPIPHRARDSGLFRPIPFIVRPIASDLDATARANYRLRRVLDIGGNLYVAYYGRVLDLTEVQPEMSHVTIDEGVSTSVEFVPTIDDLKPTQPDADTVLNSNGEYLAVAATLEISFTANEVAELRSAMNILYGDERLAIVSELALCTGKDVTVTEKWPNNAPYTTPVAIGSNRTETIGAQIAIHVSAYYPVLFTNDGFSFTLDVGATEPLFGVSTV